MDAQNGGTPGTTNAGAAPSGDMVNQAKETAQQFAGQVKDQVGQRAGSMFDQSKSRAADTLGGVAQTLRHSTQQLQDQQLGSATHYVEQAADQIDRLSQYLRTADMHDMTERAESLARRQPALFLGGLFALGLAGARFLKSSRRNESQSQPGTNAYGSSYGGYAQGASGYGASYGAGSYAGGGYAGGGYAGGSYTGASGGSTIGGSTSSAGSYGGERDVTGLSGTGTDRSAPGTGLGDTAPGGSGLGQSGLGSTGSTGAGLGSSSLGGSDPLDTTRTTGR